LRVKSWLRRALLRCRRRSSTRTERILTISSFHLWNRRCNTPLVMPLICESRARVYWRVYRWAHGFVCGVEWSSRYATSIPHALVGGVADTRTISIDKGDFEILCTTKQTLPCAD
jgi:hypothetical protein